MNRYRDNYPLDELASQLAGEAGEMWFRMAEFPGYSRTIWRDRARSHVRDAVPGSRIECLPPGWDGREGVCFIRNK